MAWRLAGFFWPFSTTPNTGIWRRRSASRVNKVWLMVPRPERATTTTGRLSISMKSMVRATSFNGTRIPPAPSTTSGPGVAGGFRPDSSMRAPSRLAASCGDKGAWNT